jgi:hypothetical protein
LVFCRLLSKGERIRGPTRWCRAIHSLRAITAQGENIREHFSVDDLSIGREIPPDLSLRDAKGENIRGSVPGSGLMTDRPSCDVVLGFNIPPSGRDS